MSGDDETELSDLTAYERLARAVLLFHGASSWCEKEKREWHALTGGREATTRVLCDLARETVASFPQQR